MKRFGFTIICCVAITLAATFPLAAQTTSSSTKGTTASSGSSSGEQTIEELYLKNVAMRILREQATELDRDSKLLALTSIQEMINNKTLAKDSPVAMDILGYLAFEGTQHEVTSQNRQINNFPEVRRRACELLGQIGGQQADKILLQVMLEDNEPMVLSQAAYALGEIGLNPDSAVSSRIAAVVMRDTIVKPDNNFAFASLLAFEKLAKRNSGLNDPLAFQAIVQISQGNYIRDVKLKALQVLDELKQYG
ncbi:MAG TPA: HEAT repeat domain-containing protein [Spirochaetia bacterium]|nr:HEAT repeat domain-containing protein [Spirochaetia bacterium]